MCAPTFVCIRTCFLWVLCFCAESIPFFETKKKEKKSDFEWNAALSPFQLLIWILFTEKVTLHYALKHTDDRKLGYEILSHNMIYSIRGNAFTQ